MSLDLPLGRSLNTRITLVTLLIFVTGIWSLALFTSIMLRADLQELLGEQQLSTAAIVATEINQELGDRMETVEQIARTIPAGLFQRPADLQRLLETNAVALSTFNGGAFITQHEGLAVASVPSVLPESTMQISSANSTQLRRQRSRFSCSLRVMRQNVIFIVLPPVFPVRPIPAPPVFPSHCGPAKGRRQELSIPAEADPAIFGFGRPLPQHPRDGQAPGHYAPG